MKLGERYEYEKIETICPNCSTKEKNCKMQLIADDDNSDFITRIFECELCQARLVIQSFWYSIHKEDKNG